MVRIEDVLVPSLAEDFLGLSFEACFTFGIMPKELLRGLCAGRVKDLFPYRPPAPLLPSK